jgi:hypothetical protein
MHSAARMRSHPILAHPAAATPQAFSDDDLKEKTGLTAAQLLLPANKAVLTQVGVALALECSVSRLTQSSPA